MQQRLFGWFGLALVLCGTLLYLMGAMPMSPVSPAFAASGCPTPAPTPISAPVRLTILYRLPRCPGSPSTEFFPVERVARDIDYVVYSAGFTPTVQSYINAGWRNRGGQAMLYVLLNGMNGPRTLQNVIGSDGRPTRACNPGERSWNQISNNVMFNPFRRTNDFCNLHDAIYNRGPFDHDYDPNNDSVYPTEQWFLHIPRAAFTMQQNNGPLIEAEGSRTRR